MKKIILLFCISFSSVFAQKGDEYIAWTEILDATGYQVEIRDNLRKIILQKKVKTNLLEIDIPKGKYEVRSAPLDIFGKPAVWSIWEPIKVIVSQPPALEEKQSAVNLRAGSQKVELSLKGKNFLEHMKIYLKNDEDKIKVSSLKVSEDGGSVVFILDLSLSRSGTYDLILSNPRKKNLQLKNYIIINESTENYSYKQYRDYINRLKKSCPGSETPDLLVQNCFSDYIYLDLSNKDKEIAYNFLLATGQNYNQRQVGYRYFAKNCNPPFNPIIEYIEDRLGSPDLMTDSLEITVMQKSLSILKNCQGKN